MSDTAAGTVSRVPTVLRVGRTIKVNGTEETADVESEEILEVNEFATTPAMIRFNYPIRKSLEYQSVGLEIGIDLPCYVEEIPQGLEKAQQIVVDQVKKLLPDVTNVLDRLVEQKLQAQIDLNRGQWQPAYKK